MVIVNTEILELESLNLSEKDKTFLKEIIHSLNEEDFINGNYYRKACEHMDRERSSLRKRIKKIINKVGSTGKLNKDIRGKDFIKMLKEQFKDDNNG